MKTLLALAALVFPLRCATAATPLDVGRMVGVMGALEDPKKEHPENPFQFEPATWAAYSKVPMGRASPQEHRRAAYLFLSDCVRQALHLDLPITPYHVATLWHAGMGTVRAGRMTAAQRDFGHRAENLYHDKTFKP